MSMTMAGLRLGAGDRGTNEVPSSPTVAFHVMASAWPLILVPRDSASISHNSRSSPSFVIDFLAQMRATQGCESALECRVTRSSGLE